MPDRFIRRCTGCNLDVQPSGCVLVMNPEHRTMPEAVFCRTCWAYLMKAAQDGILVQQALSDADGTWLNK